MKKIILLNILVLILFNTNLSSQPPPGGGGGGGGLSCGTSGSFNMPTNTNATNPSITNCFGGPSYYVNSDVDGDGCEDVNYSVENNTFHTFTNNLGYSYTFSITFTPTATLNLQATVWPPDPNGTNSCSSTCNGGLESNVRSEFGGSPGTSGNSYTLNVTLNAGQTATIMTDGYAGDADGTYTITIGCPPLGVDLLSASVHYENGVGAIIEWDVTREENLKRYFIERSATIENFIQIGEVLPYTSNSNEIRGYQLTDANTPEEGNIYYRIVSEDLDGSTATVQLLQLKRDAPIYSDGALRINGVSANPDGNLDCFLNLMETNAEQGVSLKVIDVRGRTVKTLDASAFRGSNVVSISSQGMENGIYILRAEMNSTVAFHKFLFLR